MIRTGTRGIIQTDIVLRTALLEAFKELRKNPWLLDYVFAGLIHDDLTRAEYGKKDIEEAKRWFLNTDVPIAMAYTYDTPVLPRIAISLEDESEAEATLGDVNAEGPTETVDFTEVLVKPNATVPAFTPKSYDSSTGTIVLPDSVNTFNVFEGMFIYDTKKNTGYEIKAVLDYQTIQIEEDVRANFTKAIIAPRENFYIARLESVRERQSYRIDIYTSGKSAHLLYLHSLVKFCLLKYKETLLEARGLEQTTVNSSGVRLFPGSPEVIFTRTVTVTGYVRQFWPKDILPMIDGVRVDSITLTGIEIDSETTTPEAHKEEVAKQGWKMEDDDFDTDSIGSL